MASAHHGWLAMGSRAFWKEVVNLKEHIKKDMQKPTNDMPKKKKHSETEEHMANKLSSTMCPEKRHNVHD